MILKSYEAPLRLLDAVFTDVDQMCATVQSWNLEFRPLASSCETDCAGRIVQMRTGPVDLGYARFFAGLEQFGAPPPGRWTFGVPGLPLRRLWWRGHDLGNDSVLVFPMGSELRSLSGPDFDIWTVSVEEDTIAGICEAKKLPLPRPSLRPEVFQPPVAVMAGVRDWLRDCLDTPGPTWQTDIRQTVEKLVSAWLRPPEEPKSRRPNLRARDRSIARCLEYMEASDWFNLTPVDLCKIGGLSERSLQYAFVERFGVTPGVFLKARRLGAVRASLQATRSPESKVRDLAASYGFLHAGQFAADYKRMFGERPSDTLSRSSSTVPHHG